MLFLVKFDQKIGNITLIKLISKMEFPFTLNKYGWWGSVSSGISTYYIDTQLFDPNNEETIRWQQLVDGNEFRKMCFELKIAKMDLILNSILILK